MATTVSPSKESTPRLTAGCINWTPAPGPYWPSSDDVIAAAIALLPTIDDEITAEVVEALALSLIDSREEANAIRRTQAVVLDLLHQAGREGRRLKARLAELLGKQRRAD